MPGKPCAYRMHPDIADKLEQMVGQHPSMNKTGLIEQLILQADDIEFPESHARIVRRFLWPEKTFQKLKKLAEGLGATQIDVMDAIISHNTKKK